MTVSGYQWPASQPLTSPFPVGNGCFFALRGGDVLSPDTWKVDEVKHVRRSWFWLPCRFFFSVRFGRFGFYIGNAKVFGADNEDLKKFPSVNPREIYEGSVAMQGFTWRFTRNLK